MRRLVLAGPALVAAAGLAQLALLLYIFAGRLGYGFDLEWMEGGMLCHALRAMERRPIYAPPSVDFISYLYTPLYPYLLAGLGKIFGLSYTLGRVISVASFLVVLGLAFRAVQRTVGGLAGALWGVAAVGLIASSFPHSGAWYDLVRNDSLYLALIMGALYLICFHLGSWRALILAGVLAGAAFLTKQTASLFIVLSGLAVLLMRWRRLPVYVAVVGLVAGGGVLLQNAISHGWFWRYTFGMHQGHDLYWDRIWPVTELKLLKIFPVVGAVLGLYLLAAPAIWIARRLRRTSATTAEAPAKIILAEERRELYWLAVAVTGVAVSAVGFATQWASENAYIPGLVFPAIFAAIAGGGLARRAGLERRPLLAGGVALLVGGALAAQLIAGLYRPGPHLPTARDRQAGARLIELLRAEDGPVLMPYHPFYPVLAGKRPHYHQMGINDVTRAGLPFPPSVLESVLQRRWAAILLDNPPQGRYDFVLGPYKLGRYFRGDEVPHVPTGYQVRPTYLFVPKRPEPAPAGARRVFGFEDGSYQGWERSGTAWGPAPVGGPLWEQGPVGPFEGSFLASSFHGGDQSTGELLSPEVVIDRPQLSYRVGGGHDPRALQVRLLVDGQTVHVGTGNNSDLLEVQRVDLRAHLGKKLRVQLVDSARGSWGHLLFDDLVLEGRP